MSFCNGKLEKRFVLTDEEINSNPIWEGFYPLIASKLGVESYDDVENLDCREIEIANNIQEKWFEQNKADGRAPFELALLLLNSAPKVDETLPNNTVTVSDKFMTLKRKEN